MPRLSVSPVSAAALAFLSSSAPAAAQMSLLGVGGQPRPPTSVDLAPFVRAFEPIVEPVIAWAASALALWFLATLTRWVGAARARELDAGARAALVAAAKREAGVLAAAAADNLASRQINVGSQATVDAAKLIAVELPKAIARLGITPEGVERWVVAAAGHAQTSMTRVDPAALPAPKA
jgi:hypothetical protein